MFLSNFKQKLKFVTSNPNLLLKTVHPTENTILSLSHCTGEHKFTIKVLFFFNNPLPGSLCEHAAEATVRSQ